MSKSFKRIMGNVFGNGAEPHTEPTLLTGKQSVNKMTNEERAQYRQLAYQTVREGMRVFMTKNTVKAFEGLLKTTLSPNIMRKLLEEIGNGTLVTKPAQTGAPTPNVTVTTKLTSYKGSRTVPTVMSVEELSGGLPFSLKQAAKILNCNQTKLYNRCLKGRMHFERQGSRYLIPAAEVKRLQIVGLF